VLSVRPPQPIHRRRDRDTNPFIIKIPQMTL
jgi:hypothetical protein